MAHKKYTGSRGQIHPQEAASRTRRGNGNQQVPAPALGEAFGRGPEETPANVAADHAVMVPYAHARIPRAVWYPPWGRHVSHDIPFADGWCGTIDLTLTAVTELLVGGERKRGHGQPGEVHPVRLPDGRHAIPDTTLQGMIRQVLEIATFGKLGPRVQDRRYAVRDISSTKTAEALYRSRMMEGRYPNFIPASRAIWVRKAAQGDFVEWLSCRLARIEHEEVASLFPSRGHDAVYAALNRTGTNQDTQRWKNADSRYNAVIGENTERSALDIAVLLEEEQPHRHQDRAITIRYTKARASSPGNPGSTAATLVITGKSSPTQHQDGRDIRHTKHMEFVFHTPNRAQAAAQQGWQTIRDGLWTEFLSFHEPPANSGQKVNPNWAYWRSAFDAGEPVPLFCLFESDEIASLGTAFMFKLAHRCSTHDLLANSSPEHVTKYDPIDSDSGKLDLASLIFGATGGHKGDWFARNLKRRAAFEWAITDEAGADKVQSCHNVVLLGPKNSYYPASVRQPQRQANRLHQGEVFASYTDVKDAPDATLRHPELAGSKIRPTATASLIRPVDHQVANNQLIQTKLHAVAAGTRFKTRLHVHNLRSAELGALLWALDFDGNQNACHRLGMGKPFGMGAVRISLEHVDLTRNDGKTNEWQTDCRSAFEDEMAKAMTDIERQSQSVWVWGGDHPVPASPEWKETVQVKALVKAAMPSDDAVRGYMNVKTYAKHKANGRFLAPYADKGWELARREPVPERGSAVVGVGSKTVQPHLEAGLKAGDRVSHPSHGEGIIERLTATDVFCRLRGKGWRAPRDEVTRC